MKAKQFVKLCSILVFGISVAQAEVKEEFGKCDLTDSSGKKQVFTWKIHSCRDTPSRDWRDHCTIDSTFGSGYSYTDTDYKQATLTGLTGKIPRWSVTVSYSDNTPDVTWADVNGFTARDPSKDCKIYSGKNITEDIKIFINKNINP